MQSFKILTEIWSQGPLAFAAKALAVGVVVRMLVRVAQPLRTFITLIALVSKHEWRRNQAMEILRMLLEKDEPEVKPKAGKAKK